LDKKFLPSDTALIGSGVVGRYPVPSKGGAAANRGGRALYEKSLRRLNANVPLNLDGEWVEKADLAGGSIKLVVQA